jgi:hypothetical protein
MQKELLLREPILRRGFIYANDCGRSQITCARYTVTVCEQAKGEITRRVLIERINGQGSPCRSPFTLLVDINLPADTAEQRAVNLLSDTIDAWERRDTNGDAESR